MPVVVGVSIGGAPACYLIENHISRFVEGQVSVQEPGCPCSHVYYIHACLEVALTLGSTLRASGAGPS